MSSPIHVYELRCSSCMAELDGLSTDKAFTCPACRKVFIPNEGKFLERSLNWVEAPEPCDNCVYLPFWRLDVDIQVRHSDGSLVESYTSIRDLSAVWVSAFYDNRPMYFGNPGMNLTQARVAPTCSSKWPDGARVRGIVRTEQDARRYAHLYVTQILDKEKDVTGFQINVTINGTALWAMPFEYRQSDEQLIDVIGKFTYQAPMVLYFREMIAP